MSEPRQIAFKDVNALVDWVVDARPGDMIVYYRGHLAIDRVNLRSGDALHDVAERLMKLAEGGAVKLTQRRIGADDYEYRAVRSSKFLTVPVENLKDAPAAPPPKPFKPRIRSERLF